MSFAFLYYTLSSQVLVLVIYGHFWTTCYLDLLCKYCFNLIICKQHNLEIWIIFLPLPGLGLVYNISAFTWYKRAYCAYWVKIDYHSRSSFWNTFSISYSQVKQLLGHYRDGAGQEAGGQRPGSRYNSTANQLQDLGWVRFLLWGLSFLTSVVKEKDYLVPKSLSAFLSFSLTGTWLLSLHSKETW